MIRISAFKPTRLRGKFLLLFWSQMILLGLVFVLGYAALNRLRSGQIELGGNLPKAAVAAQVLHDSDALRVIHVSLIGGGRNVEYVDKRLKRLKEVEGMLTASLVDGRTRKDRQHRLGNAALHGGLSTPAGEGQGGHCG